ncbi:MAG TPA: hypothetical protein VGP08_21135 [Pyrinomonadaceae bacterium]|jgi:hypothetical protein|nr:hypothetical protein [Pyrinomonadaceae bacterium]
MVTNKHLYAFSVLFQDKDNHNFHLNRIGVIIAGSIEEAQEQARQQADLGLGVLSSLSGMVWVSTSLSLVDNRTLERAAIEVLGVDIQPDQDAGSAG